MHHAASETHTCGPTFLNGHFKTSNVLKIKERFRIFLDE